MLHSIESRTDSFRLITIAAALVMIAALISTPAPAQPVASRQAGTSEFYRNIAGDWVGTCEQTTDGKQAETKYFSARVRELSPSSFESRFEYFRLDKASGKTVRAGDATVATSIGADGVATSRVVGKGTILVDLKPKPQQHDFIDSQVCHSPGLLQGTTTGTIKVSNMPLGLGKNGKIKSGTSSWKLSGQTLCIDQKIVVGFNVLLFTKKFTVDAHYTARRGTDLASLMSRNAQVTLKPAGKSGS